MSSYRPPKTHLRSEEDPLKSYCGKQPPRYKNIVFTKNEKKITCWQCNRKLNALKNGPYKKFVRMHPDWELDPPKNKREVNAASARGVRAHKDYASAMAPVMRLR